MEVNPKSVKTPNTVEFESHLFRLSGSLLMKLVTAYYLCDQPLHLQPRTPTSVTDSQFRGPYNKRFECDPKFSWRMQRMLAFLQKQSPER